MGTEVGADGDESRVARWVREVQETANHEPTQRQCSRLSDPGLREDSPPLPEDQVN